MLTVTSQPLNATCEWQAKLGALRAKPYIDTACPASPGLLAARVRSMRFLHAQCNEGVTAKHTKPFLCPFHCRTVHIICPLTHVRSMSFLQARRSEASSRKSEARSASAASIASRQPPENSGSRRRASRQSIARAWPGATSAQNCADNRAMGFRFGAPEHFQNGPTHARVAWLHMDEELRGRTTRSGLKRWFAQSEGCGPWSLVARRGRWSSGHHSGHLLMAVLSCHCYFCEAKGQCHSTRPRFRRTAVLEAELPQT